MVLALGDMNELGKQSVEMHKNLLEYALGCGAHKIFTLGDKMNSACDQLKKTQAKKITQCENLNALATKLTKGVKKGDILLLKGSRSMQMEKVMGYLP